MQNHYYNVSHPLRPYTHSTEANPGTLPPDNALRVAPERRAGKWPCLQGGIWVQVEDHRGKEGYVNGERTEIKELGRLPAGWSDTPPPPNSEELAAQHVNEIHAQLDQLDRKAIRPIRAMLKDVATPEDIQKLAEIEAEAQNLRAELVGL